MRSCRRAMTQEKRAQFRKTSDLREGQTNESRRPTGRITHREVHLKSREQMHTNL